MSWLRGLFSRQSPVATLPKSQRARVSDGDRILAAVPDDTEGQSWLIATQRGIYPSALSEGVHASTPECVPWDRISRASWDAQTRTFSFHILDAPSPYIVGIPAAIGFQDGEMWRSYTVDESTFAAVVRQQVERAIVHFTKHTLSNGIRLGVSVRRRSDGSLYVVSDPRLDSPDLEMVRDEAKNIIRQIAIDVGLPTSSENR